MDKLMIVATIRATKGNGDVVFTELKKLLEPTRKEDGCYFYDLHRDNEDSEFFVYYEKWESEAHLDAHMQTPHIKEYIAATDGLIAEFIVHKMTKVD